ncbi:MAG TPA: HAD hydrolase family protein [Candidatus Lustribacter sp.]|nr:HAD hydrolase family protein [Candidatus Lustribacter sp.]
MADVTGMIRAVAMDLDGTIATDDQVGDTVREAIGRARENQLATVLVTGRILADLDTGFPGLRDLFDAIVAENGAVLDIDGFVHELGEALGPQLSAALSRAGIPHRTGRILLGCPAEHANAVSDLVAALGLDAQLVRNRGQLMLVPAGISKGTGLLAALHELGLSPHNVLAVGDAENDLALLAAAEIGVAVANALPSVREHADLVLDRPNGCGVAALLGGPLVAGRQPMQVSRRRSRSVPSADGSVATVPGAGANILVTGDTGSGKSHLAGLLIEQWIDAGYSVLVVDVEGDYVGLGRLNKSSSSGASSHHTATSS